MLRFLQKKRNHKNGGPHFEVVSGSVTFIGMEEKALQETTELIVRDFEIEGRPDDATEEALFQLLSDQIAYMIEYRLDFLLSLMYRLDINEQKVNAALSPMSPEPANIGLARLVMDRQKQRIFTKQYYKPEKLDDLDGLEF